jgi:hypothetical protein
MVRPFPSSFELEDCSRRLCRTRRKQSNPKGTQHPIPGGLANSSYLLFDLESDPLEEVNLVDQYPDVLKDMMYKLQLYQQSFVPPQVNDDSNCPFTGLVNTSMGPT